MNLACDLSKLRETIYVITEPIGLTTARFRRTINSRAN